MENLIKEQGEFIEFLKRHRIYQTFETSNVMQKLFVVWNKTKREVEKRTRRKIHDIINTHCHDCHKEGIYDRFKSDSELKIVTTGNGSNVGYSTYYICHDCYMKDFDHADWSRL